MRARWWILLVTTGYVTLCLISWQIHKNDAPAPPPAGACYGPGSGLNSDVCADIQEEWSP